MQVREKTGQNLTEPITNTQLKTYIGYTATDQDTILPGLITAVRKQVEKITSLSAIEKTYQVFFNEYDSNDGWYTLPFAPVKSITSVQSNGSDIVYDESGMTEVRIYPYWSPDLFGLDVEYVASASDELVVMTECIYEICAANWMNKAGTPFVIPAGTVGKIRSIMIPAI